VRRFNLSKHPAAVLAGFDCAGRRQRAAAPDKREMTMTSPSSIEILPFDHPLGAEVICGDVRTLDEAAKQQIRAAWLDHVVLLIRDQTLTADEQVAFMSSFGEVDLATPLSELPEGVRDRPNPYISMVSNIKDDGRPIGTLGDGEVVWHSDMSYHAVPISASMLYAVEIPPAGGRTGFINMYQALETLPANLQKRLMTITIKNDGTYNSAGQIRRGMSPMTDVRTSPGVNHPAVRTHPETRCNALYLGRRPHAYVNGLPVDESEALLNLLWSHTTSLPAWFHEWRVGDVIIWDNRCAMHRREPFDPAARRLLQRAQCKGTRPVLLPDANSARHPRSRAFRSGTVTAAASA
jgi:taurine dioxygenase